MTPEISRTEEPEVARKFAEAADVERAGVVFRARLLLEVVLAIIRNLAETEVVVDLSAFGQLDHVGRI